MESVGSCCCRGQHFVWFSVARSPSRKRVITRFVRRSIALPQGSSRTRTRSRRDCSGYPTGGVTPLTRALSHEVRDLNALKSKLARESASSATGAKAKTNIVKGLGLIASAYAGLREDVLAANGAPVPAAEVSAAVNTDKAGRKKLLAGLKLLAATPTPAPTPTPTPPTPTTTDAEHRHRHRAVAIR